MFKIYEEPKCVLNFNNDETQFVSNKTFFKNLNNKINYGNVFISIADLYEELGYEVPFKINAYYTEYGWLNGKFGHYVQKVIFNKRIFGFNITKTKTIFEEV